MLGYAAFMDTGCFVDVSCCVHRHVCISTVNAVTFMALYMGRCFREFLARDKTVLQGHGEVVFSHPIFLTTGKLPSFFGM